MWPERSPRRAARGVLVGVVCVCMFTTLSCKESDATRWCDTSVQCTGHTLGAVAQAIVAGEHDGLPDGDAVGVLYDWLETKGEIPGLKKLVELGMLDEHERVFRDAWGRPLRYVHPPRSNGVVCELYSVGKNGMDENGRGDDLVEQVWLKE